MRGLIVVLAVVGATVLPSASASAEGGLSQEDLEFFEHHIRPVLVDHCYECHGGNPDTLKGGLILTYRDGLLAGGSGGKVLAPGAPAGSRLLEALRYDHDDLRMPPAGKLADDVIARFEEWIGRGAPDPRDAPPSADALNEVMSWDAVRERRMDWWSFQPVTDPAVPGGVPTEWSQNPIDAFIWERLQAEGVPPAELADPYALVRRLYFVLTGLPPTPEQVEAFVAAEAADHDRAVAETTDALLASPAFGERWGRHWMDWMRYAESHGSERDPHIPQAWRYRDYIIDALNDDVPYDDLVREHLAGDLLENPRVADGVNNSMIGTAQYRFVLHGFAPTDALDERVRFTDNQIDVVSKAFLGMTVSCARCHDHKFDPISQKDFYAFYGIMATGRPATVTVDTKEEQARNKAAIAAVKDELRTVLAGRWLAHLDAVPDLLQRAEGPWADALDDATSNQDPLHPWQRLGRANDRALEQGWRELEAQWHGSNQNLKDRSETEYPHHWKLGSVGKMPWHHHGSGVEDSISPAGVFDVRENGDTIVRGIYPAGVYSHLTSTKHSGVLASPRFHLENKQVYLRIVGDGGAVQRYVIQDYPRDGTIYPTTRLNGGDWRWQRWDVDYWQGDTVHLEISTANDQPVLSGSDPTRSWFGITEAMVVADGQPAPRDEMAEFLAPLFNQEGRPKNRDELAVRYQQALRLCVEAWRDGTMNDGQARFLDYFLRRGLLPNTRSDVPEAEALVARYRALESEIRFPTRAPGILEGVPLNQPLFARGDHKQPLDPVPRRFLEAIDPTPYDVPNAGRLALAEDIVSAKNPLAARVIANRLWHHTFGRGLVATPDNFGVMGEEPTHPNLLDYLATCIREDGWSLKSFIRRLATSRTFQLSAVPSADSREKDPANKLWSHAMVRRLEAEAIRDAMLASAGKLTREAPDKPVIGNKNYRSVYVKVIRNELDPFLTTFDAPTPVTTAGRRDSTNVPAHALTLLNDPFVRSTAAALAERVTDSDRQARARHMFALAVGRPPVEAELKQLLQFVATAEGKPSGREQSPEIDRQLIEIDTRLVDIEAAIAQKVAAALKANPDLEKEPNEKRLMKAAPDLMAEKKALLSRRAPLAQLGAPPEPWVDLAQSLFSLKEFIYLR